jgi:modulator of FtsH protease HflC
MLVRHVSGIITGFILAATFLVYDATFIVYQTQMALVIRLGQPIHSVIEPGLHLKMPLIDRAISIDRRILDLEIPAQEIIASDQKRLVIRTFARYRIIHPLKFYQTVGSIPEADSRLSTLLISALRRVLGDATFIQAVRDDRAHLTERMRDQLGQSAGFLGISIVDVRIRSADLPGQNSEAIYQRMQTERQREAVEFRAQGAQRAQEIRAKADRDVTVLIAEAMAKSEQVRGEGDAERNRIFATASAKDPDFFAFYRSMQAYEVAMPGESTRMILSPSSEFFRYFDDPRGTNRALDRK